MTLEPTILPAENALALIYLPAAWGLGQFLGAVGAWIVRTLGLAQRLDIALSDKEIREELQSRACLFASTLYLVTWLFARMGVEAPF